MNRTCPGKEDPFVLDFVNKEQEIINAFQPYYEQTLLAATTNPNRLYDLKNQIDSFQIIWSSEVDMFAKVFFKPAENTNKREHSQLHALVDPACDRFNKLSAEQQDEFKNTLGTFIRLYAFLAQIMPFADEELEKFYAFAHLLQTKLPKRLQSEVFKLEEKLIQNESLSQQAKSNSIQNFKYGFDDIFLTTLIERMEANQDIFTKIIDDSEFGDAVRDWMLKKVYNRLTKETQNK